MSASWRRVDDATLARIAAQLFADRGAAARLGAELDDSVDVLVLGDLAGPAPDRTAAAAFLLAITRRAVVIPLAGAGQHPVNLARTVATLSNLHGRRAGLAGLAAHRGLLVHVSRLWETWPLEAVVGDADRGDFVDDGRILRISAPEYRDIGGPLTLPVDVSDKPVTMLLDAAGAVGDGIDIVRDPDTIPRDAGTTPGRAPEPRGARAVLGLPPSRAFASGTPAFTDGGRLDQV